MIVRLLLVVLALVLGPAAVLAADAPSPSLTLAVGQSLAGRWVQTRHLRGFARPLSSEGRFMLLPGRGLVWRTDKPFAAAVAITAAGLVQLSGGDEVVRLRASQTPFVGHLYAMLQGALSGDWAPLEQRFAIDRGQAGGQWQVTLIPRQREDAAMAQIESLVAHGDRFIEAIEIRKSGGDDDSLTFFDQSVSGAPPAPEDLALLDRAGQ